MKLKEFIGVTLYSETAEEAITAIKQHLTSEDYDTIAACALGKL